MKNLIKKRIAFFTILAFSIFLLNSCQTENLAVENHEHSKITTKTLTGKEAETIAGRLKQLLPAKTINPKSNLQNQELASSYGTIDYSKIAVVEENGTTTYAFNIIDTNIADNKFSNLILKEENNYSTVKVAEYVMTQDFATNYYSGQEPITNFEGILNQKIISNNNPCSPDDSSAPVAGIGGGGGGGDDGTSGGSYYGGSTLGGGGGSFRLTCNDCGRSYSSIRGWQSGVCAKYDVTLVVSFSEPPTTAEPNPCDDNSTLPLIIFNENDLILQDFFRNDLNQEQRLFLSSSDPSVNDALNNYLIQNAGTGIIDSDAIVFSKMALNYLMTNPLKSDSETTDFFFKALKSTNNFQNDLTESFVQENISYFGQDVQDQILTDPLFALQIAQEYLIQRAVKKYLHPDWNEAQIYYSILWDLRHMALDAFGLIPVVGEVADLVNGTLYTLEGDKVNAAFSFASAVPVYGWAAVGVKYAVKIKTVASIGTKVKLTWKVLIDGTIYFGSNNTCRAQLRKVLGLAVGNLNQAHHIIPLNLQTNTIIQKAAKSGSAFHMNEALNGIPLSTAVHSGSHGNYDAKITALLNVLPANATPTQCYNKVNEVINKVRTAIANNPNTPLNQLNF